MKTYAGVEIIAPRIFNLGTRWGWVANFTPRQIYPWKESLGYPLDRKLGLHQSQFGRGGEEKNNHAPTGNRTPVVQPVA
jgi:hypothetical protein